MNRLDAAIPLLQQVAAGPNRELAERARIHLSTCTSRLRHLQAAPPSDSEG
jgi:DNA-binding Lrp family transcriptional regulator